MKIWLERIRGAAGMGLTWAGAWSAVGALMSVLTWMNLPGFPMTLEWIAGFAAQFAVLGFIGGAAFSTVLGVVDGRRSFEELSLPRFALWGALGGLAMWAARGAMGHAVMDLLNTLGVPGLVWSFGLSGGVIVMLGAGCSAGSLLLARRADHRALLGAGEGNAGAGLTARQARKLL